jgi:hypothetical protein
MSLKAELDAFRSDFLAKVPPEIREAMARALESDRVRERPVEWLRLGCVDLPDALVAGFDVAAGRDRSIGDLREFTSPEPETMVRKLHAESTGIASLAAAGG